MDKTWVRFVERHSLAKEVAQDLEQTLETMVEQGSVSSLLQGPTVILPTRGDLPDAESQEEAKAAVPTMGPERYERLGSLGIGGMAEVWRVRDRELHRVLAMKVVRTELQSYSSRLKSGEIKKFK